MNITKYGCAYCNEIIIFNCTYCNHQHDSSKFKYCDECDMCTSDMYHEYCAEHDNKYIITDNFYNKRICQQCIINPNKKTRYCSECEIRHNINIIDVCRICNTCMERNGRKYRHCYDCNNCYEYNTSSQSCIACNTITYNSDSDRDSESNNLSHQLLRSNSNYSNETEYSQLNLSDIDFNNSPSSEEEL
jgi:hypothetical protein